MTECWIFEGNGDQRLRRRLLRCASSARHGETDSSGGAEREQTGGGEKAEQPKKAAAKLSYNPLRELEQLPQRLE